MGDLRKVWVAVCDVTNWMELGLVLGLHNHTLMEIRQEHHGNIHYCMRSMIEAWLWQRYNVSERGVPSWSVLRAALHEIGEHRIADRIVSTSSILLVCAVNKFGPINKRILS